MMIGRETSGDTGAVATSARLTVAPPTPTLTVAVGGRLALCVTLRNTGAAADRYTVVVEGIPAAWCRVDRLSFPLDAGAAPPAPDHPPTGDGRAGRTGPADGAGRVAPRPRGAGVGHGRADGAAARRRPRRGTIPPWRRRAPRAGGAGAARARSAAPPVAPDRAGLVCRAARAGRRRVRLRADGAGAGRAPHGGERAHSVSRALALYPRVPGARRRGRADRRANVARDRHR